MNVILVVISHLNQSAVGPVLLEVSAVKRQFFLSSWGKCWLSVVNELDEMTFSCTVYKDSRS